MTSQKELPTGWKLVRLGDVCEVQNGYAFASAQFDEEKGFPLIRIRDLKTNLPSVRFDGEFEERFVVRANNLLIGMDGEFRCYRWQGVDSLLNQRVCRLIANSDRIDDVFLFYAINSYLMVIEDQTAFTTVKHISSRTIQNIELPLPPLEEQKRIAEILNKAEEVKKLREEADRKTEELIPTIFHEMVGSHIREGEELPNGWKILTLEDVCLTIKDGSHGSPKRLDAGIPLLTAKNINDSQISFEDCQYISEEDYLKESKRAPISKGDVLLTIVGTIGRSAVVEKQSTFALLRSVAILKPDRNLVSSSYMQFCLSSSYSIMQFTQKAHGVAQKGLYLQALKGITLPLPPLEEQKRIVERLNEVEKIKNFNADHNNKLQELQSSLLQKAFRGEL